jgi:antitoxin (DNA-binding transcriptional repressor) of toxin-antitoxin stability system
MGFATFALMKLVTVQAARTQLSTLIELACAGEDVVICRGRTPLVRLVPVGKAKPRRRFGAMRGRARTTKAFFAPLPVAERRAWAEIGSGLVRCAFSDGAKLTGACCPGPRAYSPRTSGWRARGCKTLIA